MACARRCSMRERRDRNIAVFNVGADLCVCPGPVFNVTPGQTHRSAPALDNGRLFLF